MSSRKQIRQFFEACRRGDVEKVKGFLSLGLNVNSVDAVGRTAGHHAARNGRTAVLKVLHKFGANLNQSTVRGITPAHQASYSGHADFLKVLVALGWRVDFTDTYEATPLEVAIELGHHDVIQFLEYVYANIVVPTEDDIHAELLLSDTSTTPPSFIDDAVLPSMTSYALCAPPVIKPYSTPVEIVQKPEPTMDVISDGPWGAEDTIPISKLKRKRSTGPAGPTGLACLLNAGRELLIENESEVQKYFAQS